MSGIYTEKTYVSCADTAKLVRKSLKAVFPDVVFSVRSKTYSGGASIDVSWTDGPRTRKVEAIAKRFEGASFDGMIDLKSSVAREWQGQAVRFGSDFVFCSRNISNWEEKEAEALAYFLGHYRTEGGKFGGYWIEDCVRGAVRVREDGQTLAEAFNTWFDPNAR